MFHVPAYQVRSDAYSRTTTIKNPTGIHARPASIFVSKASSFDSKIQLRADGKTIDAKNMAALMSMGLFEGTEVTVVADGPDEKEAVDALIELIDSKFGGE